MTMAFNHRYSAPRIVEEMERAGRSGGEMSLLYMDLDHFKSVNDKFGHAIGDIVLRMFADRVEKRSAASTFSSAEAARSSSSSCRRRARRTRSRPERASSTRSPPKTSRSKVACGSGKPCRSASRRGSARVARPARTPRRPGDVRSEEARPKPRRRRADEVVARASNLDIGASTGRESVRISGR